MHLPIRASAIIVVAVFAFAGMPATTAHGVSPSTLSIQHTPPAELVAGDPALIQATVQFQCATTSQCTSVKVVAHYRLPSGEWMTIAKNGTKNATQSFSFLLPPSAVQYPSLGYYLVASFQEDYISEPTSRRAALVQTRQVKAQSPSSGSHSVLVVNELRFRLVRQSGVPVNNASVVIQSFDPPAVWTTVSTSTGMVSFRLPLDDPWVTAREAVGYGNVVIDIFDHVPGEPQTGPVTVAGYGAFRTSFIGLGDATLNVPAVSDEVQDSTITLEPMNRVFNPQTMSSEPCDPGDCGDQHNCAGSTRNYGTEICQWDIGSPFTSEVAVHRNVGATEGLSLTHKYEISKVTSSSILGSIDFGPWFEVSGEHKTESTHVAETGHFAGPGTNVQTAATWRWQQTRNRVCREDYGRMECRRAEYVRPLEWTGGYSTSSFANPKHGQMLASDCRANIPFAVGLKLSTGRGRWHSYSLGATIDGRNTVAVKARTVFSESAGGKTGSSYHYVPVESYDPYVYWAFVPTASVDDGDVGVCPPEHPGVTWTHRSLAPTVPDVT